MNKEKLEGLKFPIGKCEASKNPSKEELQEWINALQSFPDLLEEFVSDLSVEKLNWVYRPDGWSIKQVVHHCVDSHINSVVRFKLALTEDCPTIGPYVEAKWAELPDALDDDLSDSILILKGLHKKWVKLLRSLSEDQLKREFIHPDHEEKINVAENIGIYAWHSSHHLQHIKQAIEANGKYNTLSK